MALRAQSLLDLPHIESQPRAGAISQPQRSEARSVLIDPMAGDTEATCDFRGRDELGLRRTGVLAQQLTDPPRNGFHDPIVDREAMFVLRVLFSPHM